MDKVLYKAGEQLQGIRPEPEEMTRVAAAVKATNERVAQAAYDRLAPEDEPAAFHAVLFRSVEP